MNTGSNQYYSALMRDAPALFCKAEFYASQDTGSVVERVGSLGLLVSNTAPRCSSLSAAQLTTDDDAQVHSSPLR